MKRINLDTVIELFAEGLHPKQGISFNTDIECCIMDAIGRHPGMHLLEYFDGQYFNGVIDGWDEVEPYENYIDTLEYKLGYSDGREAWSRVKHLALPKINL